MYILLHMNNTLISKGRCEITHIAKITLCGIGHQSLIIKTATGRRCYLHTTGKLLYVNRLCIRWICDAK